MATVYLRLLLLLTFWQASSSSLHGESGDREALLALKEGLSDTSGSLSSWNSTNADFCRWVGVTCSRRHPGRVSSLYLPSRGLAGIISPMIGNLTFLRTLNLDSNMLFGEMPHTIGRLHRLRRLGLANNSIHGLPVFSDKYPRVSYLELFEATDGFAPANLIGAGTYGSVYKGNLSLPSVRNAAVAVKVFALHQIGSSRSFLAECEALRRVKHRNLIDIITCCSSIDSRGNDFRALVFEFMPNYSLDRWLHPRTDEQWHKLSLVQLLNIAVDVADALDYLHNNSRPSVIHCDLKPNNILLGSDWTAYVADFGLSKLLGENMDQSGLNSGSSIGIRGTIGYVAPEYGSGGRVSIACDAYSFGITLLEMFTGRAPTDSMFREGLTLHLFAEMAFPDKISEILDPTLLQLQPYDNDERSDNILACLASVIRVGVSCSTEIPSERMSMKNAASELHRIREVVMESSAMECPSN